jgi:hypothetical protein
MYLKCATGRGEFKIFGPITDLCIPNKHKRYDPPKNNQKIQEYIEELDEHQLHQAHIASENELFAILEPNPVGEIVKHAFISYDASMYGKVKVISFTLAGNYHLVYSNFDIFVTDPSGKTIERI